MEQISSQATKAPSSLLSGANTQLSLSIFPNGGLEVEVHIPSGSLTKKQQALEVRLTPRFRESITAGLFFLAFTDKSISLSPSLEFWRSFGASFINELGNYPDLETEREEAFCSLSEEKAADFLQKAPLMKGSEYLSPGFLQSFWGAINVYFSDEIAAFKGTVRQFFGQYTSQVHITGKVCFYLVDCVDNPQRPFKFTSAYTEGRTGEGQARFLPLSRAVENWGMESQELSSILAPVKVAAKNSPLIGSLLESGAFFSSKYFTSDEAYDFLQQTAMFEKCGILCRIPDWWKNDSQKASLQVTIGESPPVNVGAKSLLDFKTALNVGGVVLSMSEVQGLLNKSEGLSFISGRWVAINHDRLRALLDKWHTVSRLMINGCEGMRQAVRVVMGLEKELNLFGDDDTLQVTYGRWLEEVSTKMSDPRLLREASPGHSFTGILRPYQQLGLNWLMFLNSLKFGACLADDMGLGKTIQVLAMLNNLRRYTDAPPSLIVAPASLLANWQEELKKFAPKINALIAHPGSGCEGRKFLSTKKLPDGCDIVITTYSMVHRNKAISSRQWNYVILDEAQAIKNHGSSQTRSVKKLKSLQRLAITGTPIENRLSDLWSIMDFLNPGLLGNQREFADFSRKLYYTEEGYAGLRKIISPYILRRLKTDKSIIRDLPDKIEMKSYCPLSDRQLALYKNEVDGLEVKLEEAQEGIQRKGLVLSSLIKLKQICNHPDQYLKMKDYDVTHSGKLERLGELCTVMREKGERVLIFTQFRQMTGPLSLFLEKIFGRRGLVLHGGTPVNERHTLVDKFQGKDYVPFFVLSLKAGGVGLNLTAANHVIHFDRWWNPAIENQATDRAFRIGQKNNVMVHKFICKDTVEDKIDAMLENKISLSNEVIQSSGEQIITEMADEEIMEMFQYGMED